MAQIVGSTPNRRPPPPPAVAACQRAVPPPTIAPQIDGTSRGDLPVVTRGAATTLGISADLSGAAFPHPKFGARAMDRPSQRGYGWRRGSRVCWGQAPERRRSARPRVKSSGPQRVPAQPSTARNRCSRPLLPALRAPAGSATHEPAGTFAGEGLAPPGGPSGISESDSAAATGAYGTR